MSTLRKKSVLRALQGGLAGILILASYVRAEDCNEQLRLGFSNINHSVSQTDSIVSAYRNFCQTSYSSASSDVKAAMKISLDFLGSFGIGGGKTLSQTTWTQICKDQSLYNKYSAYQSVDSSEISSIALAAWQNCLTLNQRGVKADFSPTPDLTGLTGSLYWAGSTPITFLGVENSGLGEAKCSVTAWDGKKYTTQDSGPGLSFKLSAKAAHFNCKRTTATDNEGRITAQTVRLSFPTSEGRLDFDLSPITLTQVESKTLSDIYDNISILKTMVSEFGKRTDVLESRTLISAGSISANGDLIVSNGIPISANKTALGTYRVTFKTQLSKAPIVVALSDGGVRGSKAVLYGADINGFIIQTRAYNTNEVSDAGFDFIVVESN